MQHPENSNVRIPNKKQPFAEVYKEMKWIICNQYKTVCSMLHNKKNLIHGVYIKTQDELTHTQRNKYLEYKNNIDRDLFTVKQVLTDIRATIMAGTRNKVKAIDSVSMNQLTEPENNPTQLLMDQISEDFLYQTNGRINDDS